MSRHEGVSCDACLRSNFRGRRYKCLICYDYDLCAICHETGSTTTRHTADHPMQCILTRADFELFYGGEALSADQPQSFVCPHCGKMGLTELSLADHVTAQHPDSATQVVCPVCASVPNGEPNHVTEDLTAHLSMDHRGGNGGGGGGSGSGGGGSGSGSGGGSRDLISFGDEPSLGARHTGRRMPHPGRGVSGPRIRRFNMHFRESMDPITELLSQLSGVRRAATSASSGSSTAASSAGSSASTASQLQQLQMHLQLERQQYAQVVRQQSERGPRRQTASAAATPATGSLSAGPVDAGSLGPPASTASAAEPTATPPAADSQLLLARIRDEEELSVDPDQQLADRIDCSVFAQEIVLSTLTKYFEECVAMSESETGASANRSEAPSVATAAAVSVACPERPAATAGAPDSAAGRTAPPALATAPRPVGAAAARSVARGGPLRVAGLVSVPASAVAVGTRVVPVRGRRKPTRPAAGAAAVDGRPMPAAEPPPPPPPPR